MARQDGVQCARFGCAVTRHPVERTQLVDERSGPFEAKLRGSSPINIECFPIRRCDARVIQAGSETIHPICLGKVR